MLLGIVCAGLVQIGQAQQKPVHFTKLREFLPGSEVPGYTRGKPGGQTSSSEATLTYHKGGFQGEEENPISISVTIADIIGVPMGAMALAMIGGTEFENESETGYEKSIKVQGFPGKETSQTGESKSAEVTGAVANRFIVTLKHEGASDAGVLRKLADNMKLADLAKAA